MTDETHPFFVEDGESRQDTAVVLLAAAEQHGIDVRDIRATDAGFRISQALADVLYAEPEPAPKAPAEPAKQPSSSKTSKTRKKAEPEPEPAPEANPENEE